MNMHHHIQTVVPGRMWQSALGLTGYRGLEVLGPGAVAHMSLHQKLTMSKNHPDINRRTAMEPRFLLPGDRLSVCVWRPTQRAVETVSAASVRGHIWGALSRVNAFLQFYFTRAK